MNNPVFQAVRRHAGEQFAYFAERPDYPVLVEHYLDGWNRFCGRRIACRHSSPGASFASALDVGRIEYIARKGSDERTDSYSAFYDNGHCKATGLTELLRTRSIDEVVVMGLAADACVVYTAHDAGVELVANTTIPRRFSG